MSGHGGIDEVSLIIGGLKEAVERMTRQWAEQERNATEGRRILHEKIDQLRREGAGYRSKLETLEKTLTEIKPAVKNFESAQQQAEGMRKLGMLLWFGIAAIAGGVGYAIHEALNFWRGPTPPH